MYSISDSTILDEIHFYIHVCISTSIISYEKYFMHQTNIKCLSISDLWPGKFTEHFLFMIVLIESLCSQPGFLDSVVLMTISSFRVYSR